MALNILRVCKYKTLVYVYTSMGFLRGFFDQEAQKSKMKYPYQPLNKHRICLQMIGVMRLGPFKQQWKNRCATIYNIVVNSICTTSLISHFICTTSRSIRYLPEFYQRLAEDFAFNAFYWEMIAWVIHDRQLLNLMTFMADHFSQANRNIIEWCHRVERRMFYGILVATAVTYCGAIIETYFPMSAEETELMRYIYKRSHPERRFQTSFWFPCIDDSESYYYEVIFYVQFFLIYLQVFIGSTAMSAIPCLVIHLIGQYKILCEFIEKFGREQNPNGFYIYYTDLKTNRFIVRNKPLTGKNKEKYEQRFCRQLIRYHHELLQFQEKFHEFYSPHMFIKMFFSDLIFALFLYQLTLSSSVSKVQLYKLLVEFFAFAFYLYSVCYVSDELDTCNVKIERAFGNSGWIKCSGRICLDIRFLVRRVQRPNHLRFYQGFIVLSKSYYLKVVKASYSMVNFLRLGVSKN